MVIPQTINDHKKLRRHDCGKVYPRLFVELQRFHVSRESWKPIFLNWTDFHFMDVIFSACVCCFNNAYITCFLGWLYRFLTQIFWLQFHFLNFVVCFIWTLCHVNFYCVRFAVAEGILPFFFNFVSFFYQKWGWFTLSPPDAYFFVFYSV